MSARTLTTGQAWVLGTAAAVMVAVGIAGAVGTFSNTLAEFGRKATAAGVVAAGEGLTLILALTMLGLTLLNQSAPVWVRVGLWLAPLGACGTGLALADNLTEAVVYGATPLGMSGAAEGLGLIARRVVIYTTGVDAEAQRRNAETLQRLAYHRARSANHPGKWTRLRSERIAWRLARHAGRGDAHLGADLVDVQRTRLTEAGDSALLDMFTVASAPAEPDLPKVTLERLDDDQVPAVEAPRPLPEVVPAGARLLPIVARPEPVEMTTRQSFLHVWKDAPKFPRDSSAPRWTVAQPVMPPVPALESGVFWSATKGSDLNLKATASVPAEKPRQVVTATVTLTPSDLRRQARRLNREAVRSNGRSVTIKTLQDELGLSRREATKLRHEVVGGERS
ncbi:conjugal transfer protein [Streptomyces sp. M2CJ-2]|uniref:conjugal transfer protein n=1 Tax=Streptomyces sp. M2CJ-2 TaxID=2803948 RepID=UPI001925A930|nr:conjugal transfer protein [Streptomyces sp. M2CJ-2]MBL3670251.1 conjugal transfer protein [Streptomyces sp. M2CJ-2]